MRQTKSKGEKKMKATKTNVTVSKKVLFQRLFTTILAFTLCFGAFAFCGEDGTKNIVENLVSQIVKMLGYVGIVVVVIGVGKFALAMKDENPDGQTRAVYYAIAGALLIGLKPIVNGLGLGITVK